KRCARLHPIRPRNVVIASWHRGRSRVRSALHAWHHVARRIPPAFQRVTMNQPFRRLTALLFFACFLALSALPAAAAGKHTFVLVHGATAGGWEWKRTGQFLTADGHTVYRPT